MTQQNEASKAPAPAVEADAGASQGVPAPNQTPLSSAVVASSDEPPAADTTSTESAQQGSGETTSEPQSAEGSESDGAADADAADGDDASAEGGDAAATEGGDPAKKKRRRRRRKKPGDKAPGEVTAAGAEGAPHEGRDKPAREGAGGVFARFFDGAAASKRHAFSAGEVVAGRVTKLNDGAFVVDLFGKATAFVDIFEPHEVPVIPDPPPPPTTETPASEAAASETPSGEGGAAPEASTEGAPAPEGAVELEGAAEAAPSPAEADASGTDAAIAAALRGTDPNTPAGAVAESVFGSESGESAAQPEAAAETSSEATTSALTTAEAPVAGGSETPAEPQEIVATTSAEAEAQSEADHAEHAEHHDDGGHEESAAEPEPAPPPPPELGSIFRGRIGSVAESGHVVLVNRIIDVAQAKQRIVRAREQRQRVRGVVYGFNRGGFDVLVEGVRVFCPASGMALGAVDNPEPLLGQRLEFTVPPAKAGTHGLVVSRRGILERQQRKAAKQLFRSLSPGQKLRGRVTQVREFGLFVDLGGFEGLVHQSELSFSRGVRPQDVAQPGDEIDVQVLRVGEGQTRKERERVSLSIKTLLADPWSEHQALLEPGNVVTGKVVRTTEFGAFIELAPQIEGLLHISELGRDLKHANQALEEGQETRVVVERVDRKARRISLSRLSQSEEKTLQEGGELKSGKPPKPGQHLTVVVDKIDHAGVVVQVPGVFGRRGRGFIPNSEMGTERGTDHRRGFPPGTQIPVKAIGVDRDGGFRFSRKALLVEEERRSVQDYRREAARHGLGTFGDLLRAKLEGNKQGS